MPMQKKRKPTARHHHTNKDLHFSYKDVATLEKYITEQGYIMPRYKTGLSQKQQRHLATAIKQARHLALMPFTQTL